MPTFQSRPYRPTGGPGGNSTSSSSSTLAQWIGTRYRASLARHPFLLFGFPFLLTIVAGSFFLTPATAVRYEKHDRRVRRLSHDEALGLERGGRRVGVEGVAEEYYRLAAKDLDDWDQKRVERLDGESDGVL
ncbi:MAG: hypothetical protein M1825_002140 [Sarcosagium campestre]|nr:MAG: hypothetical protein M1825_002140 [Sarcosagium campestre]